MADQRSADASREVAATHRKTTVIENDSAPYDEGTRQRLLIDAARRAVPDAKRILIALDADEMLTANWSRSREWESILSAEPGTVLYFDWVNILPGFETCWIPSKPLPLGFVDDGSPHGGEVLHSARIPVRPDAPSLVLRDIKVLHYQYTNWERMESKQRWYQCWECVNFPAKRAIQIFRQYHGMYARPEHEIHPFRREWIEGYEQLGIDMADIRAEPVTWWDREIVEMLLAHGPAFFRKQDIWAKDWTQMVRLCGHEGPAESVRDPRTKVEKRIHRWLHRTQARSRK